MEFKYIYLLYLSDIIWIIPAFRQRKTKYYYLFLMYALMSPVGYITYFFIVPSMYFPTITLAYFAFLSFFEIKLLKKQWYYFSSIYFLFVIGYLVTADWKYHSLLLTIIGLATILIMAHHFIISLVEFKFDIFILVLISYLFLQISQFILLVVANSKFSVNFFYFTDLFEILIGIFFIIFRADDDRLLVKL